MSDTLSTRDIRSLNKMNPASRRTELGTRLNAALEGAGVFSGVVTSGKTATAKRFTEIVAAGTVEDAGNGDVAVGVPVASRTAGQTAQIMTKGKCTLDAQVGFPAGDFVRSGTDGKAINVCLSSLVTVLTGTGANFGNQPASDTVDVVSNSALDDDGPVVTVYGTAADDSFLSEEYALNGTSAVEGTETFKNVCGVIIEGVTAGTVTVKEHSGGATITTITAGTNKTAGVLTPARTGGSAFNQDLGINTDNTEQVLVFGIDPDGDAQTTVVTGTSGTDTVGDTYGSITYIMVGDCAAATRALTATAESAHLAWGVAAEVAVAGQEVDVVAR